MAKPNPKGPVRTVQIYCAKCKFQLFKYRKGGKGALVKCFKERIVEDYRERIYYEKPSEIKRRLKKRRKAVLDKLKDKEETN